MASESSVGELQVEHSSLEQPTDGGSVSGDDHGSEDVSLDELMMDADDDFAADSPDESKSNSDFDVVDSNGSTQVPSDLETEPDQSDESDSLSGSGSQTEESPQASVDSPVLAKPAEPEGPSEAPAIDLSAQLESPQEGATDLDLSAGPPDSLSSEVISAAGVSPSDDSSNVDSSSTAPPEMPKTEENSGSNSSVSASSASDSDAPPVHQTFQSSTEPAPSKPSAGLSIEAKTGNTSPLPALNEAQGRPAPAEEPRVKDTPPPMPPVAPEMSLSAMDEDEDDAVTQIGLPLHELEGLQALDRPYLPTPPVEPRPVFQGSRSAATVVVSRVNPQMVPGGVAPNRSGSGVAGGVIERLFGRSPAIPAFGSQNLPAAQAGGKLAAILPKVSWALFGAGIVALAIVWASQRSTSQTAGTAVQALKTQSVQAKPVRQQSAQKSQPVAVEPKAKAAFTRSSVKSAGAEAVASNGQPATRTPTAIDRLNQEEGEVAKTRKAFDTFIAAVKLGENVNGRLQRFMGYASDSATRVPVFRELSSWSDASGPDMMYALWEKAPGGSAVAELAFELLYTADQRAKASPALSVVLDLRKARTCEDYSVLLSRVALHADRRALLSLRPLVPTDGCGDDGTEDCYACLRAGNELPRGIAAAEASPPPQL